VQRGLEYLGYRQLHPDGWIAPRPVAELESVAAAEGVEVTHFVGHLDGDDAELVERLWQPRRLATAYAQWLADARSLVSAAGPSPDDPTAFAIRSTLLHEWRKFLFRDPGLPKELLPPDWPGHPLRKEYPIQYRDNEWTDKHIEYREIDYDTSLIDVKYGERR